MNDEQLKRAYQIPSLTEESRANIRRRATATPRPKAPRWRLALAIGTVSLAAAFLAPTARANYLAFWLAGRLKDSKPFTVSITTIASHQAHGTTRQTPIVVSVAGSKCVITDAGGGRDGIYLFDRTCVYKYRAADGRVIVRKADSAWFSLLNMPGLIAEEIRKFRASNDVKSVGPVSLNGRVVSEWVVDTGPRFSRITLDIDPASGKAVRMVLPGRGDLPSEVFDYDRDEAKAKKSVQDHEALIASLPQFDMDSELGTLVRSLSASPVRTIQLPKDKLTIYRVEKNRDGDIFVVYTLDGKHKTEEQMGNWLRLEDASGTKWLSDVINMSFSGLKLNGQFLKAQVFFHPVAQAHPKSVKLFAKMLGGGFELDQLQRPLPIKGPLRRDLGSFVVTETTAAQPNWLYYSFSVDDTIWLKMDALKLRFIKALKDVDGLRAQHLGKELEANFPEMLSAFFYSREQLSLGLYHAFRMTGDVATAREYLQKAIDQGKQNGDYEFISDLSSARKNEGL